jgi:hypothetical protein
MILLSLSFSSWDYRGNVLGGERERERQEEEELEEEEKERETEV